MVVAEKPQKNWYQKSIFTYAWGRHRLVSEWVLVIIHQISSNVSLEHKRRHKQHSYICSNIQQYTVWVKIMDFSFMPKIIRILISCSMKIFNKLHTVNILKLIWLVICIAKNFIWTTLKMIFSIFRFFCILRFQIYKYCPIITNHTSMEILFIQLSDDA